MLNDRLSSYTRRFIIVEAAKNITVLDELLNFWFHWLISSLINELNIPTAIN